MALQLQFIKGWKQLSAYCGCLQYDKGLFIAQE